MDIQELLRQRLASNNQELAQRIRQRVEIASDLPENGERPDDYYIYKVEKGLPGSKRKDARLGS